MTWQPIETAPRDETEIIGYTRGGSVVKMKLGGPFPMNDDGDEGYTWVAVNEGEHPSCWSDGVCWSSNEDGEPSDPPIYWVQPPTDAG